MGVARALTPVVAVASLPSPMSTASFPWALLSPEVGRKEPRLLERFSSVPVCGALPGQYVPGAMAAPPVAPDLDGHG